MIHDLFFKTNLIGTYFENFNQVPEFYVCQIPRKEGEVEQVFFEMKFPEFFPPLGNGFNIIESSAAFRN